MVTDEMPPAKSQPEDAAPAVAAAPMPQVSTEDVRQQTSLTPLQAVNSTPAGGEEREPIQRLIAESQAFFGHPDYVARGAFHSLLQRGVPELTRAQGAEVIRQWLSTPAHIDESAA